jgi:hypothetical protein
MASGWVVIRRQRAGMVVQNRDNLDVSFGRKRGIVERICDGSSTGDIKRAGESACASFVRRVERAIEHRITDVLRFCSCASECGRAVYQVSGLEDARRRIGMLHNVGRAWALSIMQSQVLQDRNTRERGGCGRRADF